MRHQKAGKTENLQTIFRGQTGGVSVAEGSSLDRQQEVDRKCLRLDLPQFQKHISNIFFTFSHTDNATAADLKAKTLQHTNVVDTLFEGMCGANIMIKRAAAVQIVVDAVQTGILQHFRLLFSQKSDGAAEVGSVFLHLADAACELFNLLIGKFHTA